jgi:hypothetical protein
MDTTPEVCLDYVLAKSFMYSRVGYINVFTRGFLRPQSALSKVERLNSDHSRRGRGRVSTHGMTSFGGHTHQLGPHQIWMGREYQRIPTRLFN